MRYLRAVFVFFIIFIHAGLAFSDNLRISQIDNTSMLINQRIKLYISVTDNQGVPIKGLNKDSFSVFESTEESAPSQRDIISVRHGVNINQGINLLLVLDNSGSMYWDGTGKIKNSLDESIWRITHAQTAVLALLKEIKNPLDRVGLVAFNMEITQQVELTNEKVAIERALGKIERPKEEEAFTELFETLYRSVDSLSTVRGRKVIIVLSDGVDFPMENNPHFPVRFGIDGAVELAQKEGISVFTIGLSPKADRKSLGYIAQETGGAYFSVYDPEHLESLYNLIRDQILNEYLVTYPASMDPATKKLVTVNYKRGEMTDEAERVYFSGTIFGFPWERICYLFFLFIPGSILLMWILSLLKFEKKSSVPSLNVLTIDGKRKKTTLALEGKKSSVTISAAPNADLTISGDSKLAKTEVKIVKKGDEYTITSSGGQVTVNNRSVRTKALRPGDLIKVGGTEVVFDGRVLPKVARSDKGKKSRTR